MTAQNSVTEEQRKPWAESIAKSASLGYPIAEQALAYEDFQNGDWVSGRKHLDRLRGLNVALALEVEGAVANFGWEGPSDQGEALRKYQASIEAGDNYVIEAASILSAQGDWRGYFAMLRHGVAVGDPAATRFLGYWTQFGKREAKEVLITPNITEAKRLDAAAAAGGDSVGLHNYAIQLWYRSADSLDHRRACNLMLQSAYLGSVLAMFDLAKMLATSGSECGLNGMTPRILYEHAADAGNVDALLALGDAYKEGGLGLRVNAAEAAQCYRRVVESDEATDDQKSEARKKITELEKQP